MKNILKYFYNVETLKQEERTETENTEKADAAHDALEASLSDEQYQLFENFYEHYTGAMDDEKCEVFKNAFKMGFWLAMELQNYQV